MEKCKNVILVVFATISKKWLIKTAIALVFSQFSGIFVAEAVNPELMEMFRFWYRQYFNYRRIALDTEEELVRKHMRLEEVDYKHSQTDASIDMLEGGTQEEKTGEFLNQQKAFFRWLNTYKTDLEDDIAKLENIKEFSEKRAERCVSAAFIFYRAAMFFDDEKRG